MKALGERQNVPNKQNFIMRSIKAFFLTFLLSTGKKKKKKTKKKKTLLLTISLYFPSQHATRQKLTKNKTTRKLFNTNQCQDDYRKLITGFFFYLFLAFLADKLNGQTKVKFCSHTSQLKIQYKPTCLFRAIHIHFSLRFDFPLVFMVARWYNRMKMKMKI